uniref:Uncharacterized protein n=1 Tax=Arundo donax TaxID=35708 RepID=A0A0A9CHE8_ARUDO
MRKRLPNSFIAHAFFITRHQRSTHSKIVNKDNCFKGQQRKEYNLQINRWTISNSYAFKIYAQKKLERNKQRRCNNRMTGCPMTAMRQ